jgi:transformer-2 protein
MAWSVHVVPYFSCSLNYDQDLHGRRIRVDYSLTERAHPSTPGQYMGHRRREPYERDREYRSSRYDRDRYDRDRYDRDRHDRGHDRGHDRDRRDRDRDRDRDAFGRDHRRRSPERRSRRSYSRSPPRGGYSSPPRKDYDQEINVPAGSTNANGDAANW